MEGADITNWEEKYDSFHVSEWDVSDKLNGLKKEWDYVTVIHVKSHDDMLFILVKLLREQKLKTV